MYILTNYQPASLALLVFSPVGKTQAQVIDSRQINPQFLKMTPEERIQKQRDYDAAHPLLTIQRELTRRALPFPDAHVRITGTTGQVNVNKVLHLANAATTIWANLASRDSWTDDNYGPFGYYSFAPVSPLSYDLLIETLAQTPCKNGVQYKDGHIYGVNYNNKYAAYGIIAETLYDTDTKTGKTTSANLNPNTQMDFVALETAQASDGTVYGLFYNADGSAFEWGTVDYSTKTRSKIADAQRPYVALGISKENQLYGIASDGNLYKIDKSNGQETLVGATGLTVANASGQYYGQTGEIDQRDNVFYWFAIDSNGKAGLYEVDLATGKASKISDSSDQLYGMMIAPPEAADGAPSKITDAELDGFGTGHDGTLTFTAPTQTYGGGQLSGTLEYALTEGTDTLADGNVTPGSKVSKAVSISKDGEHTLFLSTSNSAGSSPKTKLSVYIGFDTPASVTELKADKESNKSVRLSWTAPKDGVNGGVIDTDNLSYDIIRKSYGVIDTIAKGIKETSYTDTPSGTVASYLYGVIAKTNTTSGILSSNTVWTEHGVTVGDAIDGSNWNTAINSEDIFALFTVIDANNDSTTWNYDSNSMTASSDRNYKTGNDDWLISPAIKLKGGHVYSLSFRARNLSRMRHNTLEVKYGQGNTVAALTNTVFSKMEPPTEFEVYKKDIYPSMDGDFNVGFHDNTASRSMSKIHIDSIAIEDAGCVDGPDSVTSFKAVAGEKGALSATLKFNIADTLINGQSFENVDSIVIKRDGKEINVLGSKAKGASVSFNDESGNISSGFHTYDVICYVKGKYGRSARTVVYIGKDIPGQPQDARLADNAGNVVAKWNSFPTTGINNAYLAPNDISVEIHRLVQTSSGYYVGRTIKESGKGATEVELDQNPELSTDGTSKTQEYYQVAAVAKTNEGKSDPVVATGLVIGPTIKAPFKESFKNGETDNGFAWTEGNDQYNNNIYAAGWTLYTESSADNDRGCVRWASYSQRGYSGPVYYDVTAGDEVSFNTPKICVKGEVNPVLYFSLNATKNDPAKLNVIVARPDGEEETVAEYDLSATNEASWIQKTVNLKKFASERYVIIKFRGIATGNNANIALDNINVYNQFDHNLAAVNIIAPSTVRAGKAATVSAVLENFGANTENGYSVILYSGDKAVDTVSVEKSLPVMGMDTVRLSLPVSINATEKVSVKAKVVLKDDGNPDDDNISSDIAVKASEYAKATNLKAEATDKGVTLSWTKPEESVPVPETETFESYNPFTTDFGQWTTVDGDKGLAGKLLNGIEYPGQGTAFAFKVFNPDKMTDLIKVVDNNPGVAPHGGEQYAAAPYVFNSTQSAFVAPDNWLVSPQLSGKKQTVKFYVLNIASKDQYGTVNVYKEPFDVLYTEGSVPADTTKFVKLGSYVADGSNAIREGVNWKQISVEIPAGANFFAIHQYNKADSTFLFGIDDISYDKGTPGVNDSIIGYNVYRDGELVVFVGNDSLAYVDVNAGFGNHIWNVTVVYKSKDGAVNESGFSNDAVLTVTGIQDIAVNDTDNTFNVYTVDGKIIRKGAKSLNGLERGVYVVNGNKMVLK